MQINLLTDYNILHNKLSRKNIANNPLKLNQGLNKDVFEKSTISFKGEAEDENKEMAQYCNREIDFKTYIDAYCKKTLTQILMNSPSDDILEANTQTFANNELDVEFLNKILKEAGITTNFALLSFIQTYGKDSKARQVFKYQDIEALEIYSKLDSKADIKKFPELLLFLYYDNKDSQEGEQSDFNEFTSFLKKIGLENFDEFDEKFGYLKPAFYNFEETADKANATLWLMDTYEDKIGMLNQKINSIESLKSQNAQDIYSQINDVIDYYYVINDEQSLDGLESVIESAMNFKKIKKLPLNRISGYFNNFDSIDDKIDFLELLSINKMSAGEFNNFMDNPIISDTDIIECISNKEYFSSKIASIKSIKPQEAQQFYASFKDVINASCDTTSKTNENLKLLINVISTYKIKNSASMISFYNKMTNRSAKTITSKEFKEFIELFNYPVDSIMETAKKEKCAPVELLKAEKRNFDSVKEDIEDGKLLSGSILFASQETLDIYKKYRELILNSNNIADTIREIAFFNIEDSKEYEQKKQYLSLFKKFFDYDSDLLKFFQANGIKLDNSESENEFINNCLEILNFIQESENEELKERFNYYLTSDFLGNSQNKLNEFLEKTQNPKKREMVLITIADKKIPSIEALEKFINSFKAPSSNGNKVFKYIKNLPDEIDFNKASTILYQLSKEIAFSLLPVQINENNMELIKIENYENKTQKERFIELLNNLYEPQADFNFLRTLSSTQKTYKQRYTPQKIADEIAKNIDKSEESYQNLTRLLGLEKHQLGLDEEKYSQRMYAKIIESILPKELINTVNSDELFGDVAIDNSVPNVSLHGRLRLIDRYILNETDDIGILCQEETKEKIKNLYSFIFKSKPYSIEGSSDSTRFAINFRYNSQIIKVIFTKNGEMLTISPLE